MRLFLRGSASVLLTLCSFFVQASDYPMTVVDGMGNSITLAKAPESIASLTLFTDEVLLDMVDAKRLSHMTNLATDPTFSNITDRVPATAKLTELNVEVLLSDYPDIIFAANWSEAPLIEQLTNAGLTVYLVNTPFTMDGIAAEILKLGRIVGEPEQAQTIVDGMQHKLAQAKSLIRYETLNALDYSTWGASSGKNTTFNAIVSAAGLTNTVAEFEADGYGQVAMSKELIVDLNPDVLFLPGFVWGDPKGADNFKQQVVADPALSDVAAVQQERIVMLPESLRGTYSQYIADSVLYVVEQLNALQ